MRDLERGSVIGSLVGILICGGGGGLAAWFLVGVLGVQGVPGALLAGVIAMVVATALWAAGFVLLRKLGLIREPQ